MMPKTGGGHAGDEQARDEQDSGSDTSEPVAAGPQESTPKTAAPKAVAPKIAAPKAAGIRAAGDKAPENKPAGKTQGTPRTKAPAGKIPPASASASGKAGNAKSGSPQRAAGAGAGDSAPGGGAQVLAFPVPEYKRRRRNVIYTVTGVVVVLALVMAVALFSPALAVKTITFEGNKLVGEEVLQGAVAPILNKPLPQVTDAQVQELLSSVVQVKSSHIEARPPSTLLIHIVERVPVALLKNEEEYLLVDQDGVQLGSTADPGTVALPLIDGGKAVIGQDTFRAMTAVLANLPQSILGQLANATAESPDAVELKLADGRSVIWGNASDMELKAQVLEALLSAPPPTAPAGKPVPEPAKVFDVSAPRHPVTR